MTKHWLSITYEPKIEAVFDGSCTQTIRPGWKYSVGDYVGYHLWEGLPYRSKWGRRTKLMEIVETTDITVFQEILIINKWMNYYWYHPVCFDKIYGWNHELTDRIAKQDHINPSTGIALRDVLKSFYGELNGQEMQIIRWNPKKVIE